MEEGTLSRGTCKVEEPLALRTLTVLTEPIAPLEAQEAGFAPILSVTALFIYLRITILQRREAETNWQQH